MTAGCAAEADSAQFFIYLIYSLHSYSFGFYATDSEETLKAPAVGAVLFGAPHYQPTPGLSPPPCSEELPGPTPHLRPQHPTEQTPKPRTSAPDPHPPPRPGPAFPGRLRLRGWDRGRDLSQSPTAAISPVVPSRPALAPTLPQGPASAPPGPVGAPRVP